MRPPYDFFQLVLEGNIWFGLETLLNDLIEKTKGLHSSIPIFGRIEQWTVQKKVREERPPRRQIVIYPALNEGKYFRLDFATSKRKAGLSEKEDRDFYEFFLENFGLGLQEFEMSQNSCVGPYFGNGPQDERKRFTATYDFYTIPCQYFDKFICPESIGLRIVAEKNGCKPSGIGDIQRFIYPADEWKFDADFPFNPEREEVFLAGLHRNCIEYVTRDGIRIYDNRLLDIADNALLLTLHHYFAKQFQANLSRERRARLIRDQAYLVSVVDGRSMKKAGGNYGDVAQFLEYMKGALGKNHFNFSDLFGDTPFKKKVAFKNLVIDEKLRQAPFPEIDHLVPEYLVIN